jgi:hypothetical protein
MISLSESSLFKDLRGPPTRFFILLLHPRLFRPNPRESRVHRRLGRRSGPAQSPAASIEPPLRPGNSFVNHACLARRREIGVLSSEGQYAHFRRICKKKSKKPLHCPELLTFEDTVADGVAAIHSLQRTDALPGPPWRE